jgi:hypothetical protein
MAICLAVLWVFTSLVQQYWMPTDVYRQHAPMHTACRVDVQFAGKKPPRHIAYRQCIDALCKQGSASSTDSRHCMVSIAISVCMFFPYSKNAGAEFVSKIDLAIVHPSGHCPCRPTLLFYDVHTTWHSYSAVFTQVHHSIQNNYNGKVPDISMHTLRYVTSLLVYILLWV